MTSEVDEAKETKDEAKDVKTSEPTSEKTEATSPSPKTAQKVVAKTEAELESDRRAEEGREIKKLKERLEAAEAKLRQAEEKEFAVLAKEHGKSVEELAEQGITNVEELNKALKFASVFGEPSQREEKPAPRADSARSVGAVGELTVERVLKMTPEQRRSLDQKELAKLPLGI